MFWKLLLSIFQKKRDNIDLQFQTVSFTGSRLVYISRELVFAPLNTFLASLGGQISEPKVFHFSIAVITWQNEARAFTKDNPNG